ncbi:unnamed protein product [Trichogramma brassicae]|uniref:Uncharacterized protein n=1 Tax=Trichogramma brassicae TaxID=86971 RepID=A0A6H5HWI1_9HYME|nr:unnamed protein product [Trichogramma brassicae]
MNLSGKYHGVHVYTHNLTRCRGCCCCCYNDESYYYNNSSRARALSSICRTTTTTTTTTTAMRFHAEAHLICRQLASLIYIYCSSLRRSFSLPFRRYVMVNEGRRKMCRGYDNLVKEMDNEEVFNEARLDLIVEIVSIWIYHQTEKDARKNEEREKEGEKKEMKKTLEEYVDNLLKKLDSKENSKKLGAIQCSGARGANINNKARLAPSVHTCFLRAIARAPMTRALLYRRICMCTRSALIGYRRRERYIIQHIICILWRERREKKRKRDRGWPSARAMTIAYTI